MSTRTDLTEVDAPLEEEEAGAARPAVGRVPSLPLGLLIAGVLLVVVGIALSTFPADSWVAERVARLALFGLAPSSLLGLGAGIVLLSLVLLEMRRTEERIAQSIEAAMVRLTPTPVPAPVPAPAELPRDLVERFAFLARAIESLRPILATIQERTTKAVDGAEETYRSVEAVRERLRTLRKEAGLAGAADLVETRASIDTAAQTLRASVESLTRAATEERNSARAVAEHSERIAAAVTGRLGAITDQLAAIASRSEEVPEIRAGLERLQIALREMSRPPRTTPSPPPAPPPPPRAAPPATPRAPEPVASWDRRRSEDPGAPLPSAPARTVPSWEATPGPPSSGKEAPDETPRVAAGATEIPSDRALLGAIERLRALKKTPAR